MRPKFNVAFANSFSGATGGTININASTFSAPTSIFKVVQSNGITATAQYQVINGIEYVFDHWSDATTSNPKTFTISSDNNLIAYFNGKPHNSYRGLSVISSVGQPITIDWNEHPNTAVTSYSIYRKVKHNGVLGSEELIGTRSRGTTIFTDNEYTKTSSYVDLVYYDVRAYYSTEGTYSVPDFISVYGESFAKPNDTTSTAQSIPAEFSLSNYPNPFNPSKNINFTIPEAANVKLTIYNMLGEKVKELLNRNYEAGTYTAQWNGDDQFNNKVISGVYFSVLQTNEKRIVQKMILSK